MSRVGSPTRKTGLTPNGETQKIQTDRIMTNDTTRYTACHEAGHIVTGWHSEYFSKVTPPVGVTIDGDSPCVWYTGDRPRPRPAKTEPEADDGKRWRFFSPTENLRTYIERYTDLLVGGAAATRVAGHYRWPYRLSGSDQKNAVLAVKNTFGISERAATMYAEWRLEVWADRLSAEDGIYRNDLERIANALLEKQTLLWDEIQEIMTARHQEGKNMPESATVS